MVAVELSHHCGGGEKDGCLTSRGSGMEACVQPLREIFPKGVIHITFLFGAIGVIGTIASVASLAITLYDKYMQQKEK